MISGLRPPLLLLVLRYPPPPPGRGRNEMHSLDFFLGKWESAAAEMSLLLCGEVEGGRGKIGKIHDVSGPSSK